LSFDNHWIEGEEEESGGSIIVIGNHGSMCIIWVDRERKREQWGVFSLLWLPIHVGKDVRERGFGCIVTIVEGGWREAGCHHHCQAVRAKMQGRVGAGGGWEEINNVD
jgi:hypothetical protein